MEFPVNGVPPIAGWFIKENPNLTWMISGYPYFTKPPYIWSSVPTPLPPGHGHGSCIVLSPSPLWCGGGVVHIYIYVCIYIYNVHMALITPPPIKYANSRFTIIKPPRNKVRQLFCSRFFPFFPFSIRFQLGNSFGNTCFFFEKFWSAKKSPRLKWSISLLNPFKKCQKTIAQRG